MSRRIHRPSGAQPGNHNALKHGFYSKFRTVGRVDHVPARAAAQELDHDIALTRATLRDLFANDPHNAKLITYTLSLQDRLIRTRQSLIERARRSKLRQSRRGSRDSRSITLRNNPDDCRTGNATRATPPPPFPEEELEEDFVRGTSPSPTGPN